MSARVELAVRRSVAGVHAALGTRGVSLSLLALSAAAAAISAAWSAWGEPEEAARFATSPACWAVALALAVDGAVGAARLGRDRSASTGVRWSPALLRAGQIAWALALLASIAGRSGFGARVAEGEEFSGGPEQLVAADPPRWLSAGALEARFAVEALDGPPATSPQEISHAVLRLADGTRASTSRHRPLWLGEGRFVRPVGGGWALRYELSTAGGKEIETAFAKLDLDRAGKVDSIRLASVPYRVFVALAGEQPPDRSGPALDVAVYRGKRVVAQGALAPGMPLAFEGGQLRFPEARRWATFRITSDPGAPLACLALALGIAGGAAGLVGRATGRASGRSSAQP